MTITGSLRLVDGRHKRSDIENLFRSTIAGGEAMPFFLDCLDDYTDFCLDWYFSAAGGHVIAAVDDERLVGYALVSTDPSEFERYLRPAILKLARVLFMCLISGRLDALSRRFYRDRIRDAWVIWRHRHRIDVADEAHAHMNISSDARIGRVAAELLATIDTIVTSSGRSSWVGEVNGEVGKRRKALTRIVGDILDERPNITATRVCGRPIVRYTVRRSLSSNQHVTARG